MSYNVILTGATGGVGEQVAKALYADGARVLLSARNEDGLAALSARIQASNGAGEVLHLPCDLSDLDKVPTFATHAVHLLGGTLDILINNAGLAYHSGVTHIDPDELKEVFNVNVLSPIVLTTRVLPFIRASANGKIINVSSFLGVKAMKHTACYTASKHALTGFSNVLRLEEALNGVSVTLIEPGAIATSFTTRTHDPEIKQMLAARKLNKIPAETIATWILHVIRTPAGVCPEVIRITPTEQAI